MWACSIILSFEVQETLNNFFENFHCPANKFKLIFENGNSRFTGADVGLSETTLI